MLNNDKMIVGYDLSYQYAQISYCRINGDALQTYAMTDKSRQFNIPLCLFKRDKVNQWFFGKEAVALSGQENGCLLDNLLMMALDGGEIEIEDETFEPIALLALYIKRTLHLPEKECRMDKVAGIMFTLPVLTDKMIALMQKLLVLLNLDNSPVAFQSREESIYHYMLHQNKELWKEDVLFYDCCMDKVKSYRLRKNNNTRPVVSYVEEAEHGILFGEEEEKDGQFLHIVQESAMVSDGCAFLLGDGFNGEWCRESLRLLCQNRRVFKGNDLYSKGACYAMQSKLKKDNTNQMIFLSKDMIRTNVGMHVLRQGEESYLAIIDGGANWYECKKEWDVILTEGNELVLRLTPLDGRNAKNVVVVLDELPNRRPKTTRLHIQAKMNSSTNMELQITDKGFGEFVPSQGLQFVQQINLSMEDGV